MKNYRTLKVDCCSNCRWSHWDFDGVGECLQSKITEEREFIRPYTTYLMLEVISDLGVCDLYEGGRNVYLPEEDHRD